MPAIAPFASGCIEKHRTHWQPYAVAVKSYLLGEDALLPYYYSPNSVYQPNFAHQPIATAELRSRQSLATDFNMILGSANLKKRLRDHFVNVYVAGKPINGQGSKSSFSGTSTHGWADQGSKCHDFMTFISVAGSIGQDSLIFPK
jgi:hypothetical protein